ncbi:hypothetical protein Tco_0425592 [Tanacetum coccineum]
MAATTIQVRLPRQDPDIEDCCVEMMKMTYDAASGILWLSIMIDVPGEQITTGHHLHGSVFDASGIISRIHHRRCYNTSLDWNKAFGLAKTSIVVMMNSETNAKYGVVSND